MFKLHISKDCWKFFRTLEAKQFRQVVSAVIDLAHNPEPHDSSQLVDHPFRRVDVGEYRIISRLQSDTVYVPVVAKRNDREAYKLLRRLK